MFSDYIDQLIFEFIFISQSLKVLLNFYMFFFIIEFLEVKNEEEKFFELCEKNITEM